ncbi:MAG: SusD/RagB family nutrient-binding outer membrane lipoprotein [Niabella sp.]
MKRNFKIGLVGCLLVLIVASSCTKDFNDINTNPISYSSKNFDPNFVFTTAELTYSGSTDYAYETWRGNLIYASTMMQGLASLSSYWAGDKYMLTPWYTSAYWERAYSEQVKPIVDIVESTRGKAEYNNIYNVARIWKALIFARLTDLYGDIPYSEAGMGYYSKQLKPKFDGQESIYKDILKELDEASAAIDPSKDALKGDIVYNGDLEKWRRLGYSAMLRCAMRLVKVDETTAKTYAQKAVGKTFVSNDDNARIKHDINGGRATQNRNAQVFLDGGQEHYYVRWSKTFIDFLKANNDPRLKVAVTNYFTDPATSNVTNPNYITAAASQKGMPNGKDLSGVAGRDISSDPAYTKITDYSQPHPDMLKRDAPSFVMTYSEAEFLWAEASTRWSIGGSAADHYKNGVAKSIATLGQWGANMAVTDADADAFAAAHPLQVATALQQINEQIWLQSCITFNFYEAWSNWRRTGYPVLTPVNYPNNATNGVIPRRFPYPTAEEASNPDNYKAASAAVPGGDLLTGRVWWDKQ